MSNELYRSLAIQSWCFRCMKTNAEVISALRSCGVSAVVNPVKDKPSK